MARPSTAAHGPWRSLVARCWSVAAKPRSEHPGVDGDDPRSFLRANASPRRMFKDMCARVEAATRGARLAPRAPCSWAAPDVEITLGLDGVWRVGGPPGGQGARLSRAFS
eukprot:10882079-Alexandrium_andersonii.AAC.1